MMLKAALAFIVVILAFFNAACGEESPQAASTVTPQPTATPMPVRDASEVLTMMAINRQWAGIVLGVDAGVYGWEECSHFS